METYCTILTRRDVLTTIPQVFLRLGPSGWRLPVFAPPKEIYDSDAKTANALVREQLGVSVLTRQSLRLPPSLTGGPLNIYIMEMRNDGGSQSPVTDGTWFGGEALREIEFALPTERATLTAWFDEAQGGNTSSLPLSWWQEGWFETTARWLQTQIMGRGGTILAPVEQVRNAYTSALVRVLTDQGYLYLKVVPEPFARKEIA